MTNFVFEANKDAGTLYSEWVQDICNYTRRFKLDRCGKYGNLLNNESNEHLIRGTHGKHVHDIEEATNCNIRVENHYFRDKSAIVDYCSLNHNRRDLEKCEKKLKNVAENIRDVWLTPKQYRVLAMDLGNVNQLAKAGVYIYLNTLFCDRLRFVCKHKLQVAPLHRKLNKLFERFDAGQVQIQH